MFILIYELDTQLMAGQNRSGISWESPFLIEEKKYALMLPMWGFLSFFPSISRCQLRLRNLDVFYRVPNPTGKEMDISVFASLYQYILSKLLHALNLTFQTEAYVVHTWCNSLTIYFKKCLKPVDQMHLQKYEVFIILIEDIGPR